MDEVDERRREWKAIHEREEERRMNIQELKKLMECMGGGKKTAKSLLKLVVYTGGIKASEAADIIGVSKNVIDGWITLLISKGLAEVESRNNPNPNIKPTKGVLIRFKRYQKKRHMMESKSGGKRLIGAL
ncbi:MAG: hypothetical protein V1744_03215 [Candidatus Altiarchaeota archaeon]